MEFIIKYLQENLNFQVQKNGKINVILNNKVAFKEMSVNELNYIKITILRIDDNKIEIFKN